MTNIERPVKEIKECPESVRRWINFLEMNLASLSQEMDRLENYEDPSAHEVWYSDEVDYN